jgi:hypothetical protein
VLIGERVGLLRVLRLLLEGVIAAIAARLRFEDMIPSRAKIWKYYCIVALILKIN